MNSMETDSVCNTLNMFYIPCFYLHSMAWTNEEKTDKKMLWLFISNKTRNNCHKQDNYRPTKTATDVRTKYNIIDKKIIDITGNNHCRRIKVKIFSLTYQNRLDMKLDVSYKTTSFKNIFNALLFFEDDKKWDMTRPAKNK